jgi:hypothetical protein
VQLAHHPDQFLFLFLAKHFAIIGGHVHPPRQPERAPDPQAQADGDPVGKLLPNLPKGIAIDEGTARRVRFISLVTPRGLGLSNAKRTTGV